MKNIEEYYVCRVSHGYSRDGWFGERIFNYLYLGVRRTSQLGSTRPFDGVHYSFVLTHEVSEAKQFSSLGDANKMLEILALALEDGYSYYHISYVYEGLECVKIKHILRKESFEVVEE